MMNPSLIKELNNEEITFRDKLKEFLCYTIIPSFIRKFFRFIKRVIRWLPVLWKQEEWDYEYIYDLLKIKMLELRKSISEDTWHEEKSVKRELKEIDICLARLDRWRNWIEYYDYPTDDIKMLRTSDGTYKMKHFSEANEIQRRGASIFEEKNYNKFWKDFLRWHRNWWT